MLDRKNVKRVIQTERECVRRAGRNECERVCGICDLLLEDTEILAAYDYVLEMLGGQNDADP